MPGPLLTSATTVVCAHGGQARATQPFPRVRAGGAPAVTAAAPYTITGCALPSQSGGPCVSAQWVTPASRVRLGGVPAVLADARAVCTPTGTPLTVAGPQQRAKGV
ncbi:hypothetical protein [Catenuloplanes japonicus]|uniref:hypothetical protein n=1 Tax=Catenuloplanes japonicus TaxID=33876 RepID=UPI0005273966|nr:hypothetical protein [Catenuloplanes japonicus]